MSWHAVDAMDDAVQATRGFLFPFGVVRWTKLALLVLLMGGSGVSASTSVPAVPDAELTTLSGSGPGTIVPPDGVNAIDGRLVAAAVAGVVLVITLFTLVSLSLRLVFYDALRTNEVRIYQPFLARLRQAFGLFIFSTGLTVITALPVGIAAFVVVAGNTPIGWQPIDSLAASVGSLSAGSIAVLGLLGAGITLVGFFALRFTYEFVVPTMVVEDAGVIAGWQRLSTVLRGNSIEVLVYLVVHFVISIGISILEGIAAAIAGAAVAVVSLLVILIAAVPLGGLGALVETTAGIVAIVVVVSGAIAALLVVLLPIRVVTRSYRIVYEVTTLTGLDPRLAILHPDFGPTAPEPEAPSDGSSGNPSDERPSDSSDQ